MLVAGRVRDEHPRLRGGRARQGPSPQVRRRRTGTQMEPNDVLGFRVSCYISIRQLIRGPRSTYAIDRLY